MQPPHGCEWGRRSRSPWGNHISYPIALTGHISHRAALKLEQVPHIADTPLPVLKLKEPSNGRLFSKDRTPQPIADAGLLGCGGFHEQGQRHHFIHITPP